MQILLLHKQVKIELNLIVNFISEIWFHSIAENIDVMLINHRINHYFQKFISFTALNFSEFIIIFIFV